MILVLTYSMYEQCTDPVVDWLLEDNVSFFKLNLEDLVTKKVSYCVDVINNDILIEGKSIKDAIDVIWYRRFYSILDYIPFDENNKILEQVNEEADSEIKTFLEYLKYFFKDKIIMPEMPTYGENKLIFLDYAKKAGLSCPETIVTNDKEELLKFYYRNDGEIISKPLYFSNYFIKGEETYSIYTTTFKKEMVEKAPDKFFPTLFQEKVSSLHEIRIFYLDGKIFSTAAITTNSEKNVDIKLNYYTDHIHWVNYQLPQDIEDKLRVFMKSINLNTGSIDILKTENGFKFIEVNPVGQFLAPGNYGNYYLEYEIKNWLKQQLEKCGNVREVLEYIN
ncbi:hypothetical protein [Tenacibaculum ascidiaceicola]|uniref:hypothetical protein n=1 Tax=Tenacibaculum ascidiaceicola TaxID=1699411 RepID=UPI0038947FED